MNHARHTIHASSSQMDFAVVLRARGLKATPQRLALLTVLATASRPLALHDIEEHPVVSTVNQSTLYRAVKECVEVGIIRPVDLRHAHAHYELVSGDHHHHLICVVCGVVEDFVSTTCATVTRVALASSTSFATITDHSFELYGTCKACRGSHPRG